MINELRIILYKICLRLKIRALVFRSMCCILAFLSLLVGADIMIEISASGKVFRDAEKLEPHRIGLVLGCRPGSYSLTKRLEAAAELYHSGKVEYLLVSGDNRPGSGNSRRNYDEPTEMLLALRDKGVPADKIYRDYAGFRTLDSVIRAKEVFQTDKLIIVSQRYHLERAIFLAEENGIEAVGYYNSNWQSPGLWARERLARLKAVIDIAFNTEPKFLGRKIIIGKRG